MLMTPCLTVTEIIVKFKQHAVVYSRMLQVNLYLLRHWFDICVKMNIKT